MDTGTKADSEPAKVLVVVSGDGFIEVFTKDNVTVRIVQTAYNGRKSIGTKVERLCMEYVRRDLPETWREIWTGGKSIASFMFKKLFVSDLHKAETTAKLLSDLPEMYKTGMASKDSGNAAEHHGSGQ